MIARPGNHTGPGQTDKFVVPSFVKQIQQVAHGELDTLHVGNLDCIRDFTDVRDVVRAYQMILEDGSAGEVYNISSGLMLRIGDILKILSHIAGVTPNYEVDPKLYRPTDKSATIDATKINQCLGWSAKIPFHQTLEEMFNHSWNVGTGQ